MMLSPRLPQDARSPQLWTRKRFLYVVIGMLQILFLRAMTRSLTGVSNDLLHNKDEPLIAKKSEPKRHVSNDLRRETPPVLKAETKNLSQKKQKQHDNNGKRHKLKGQRRREKLKPKARKGAKIRHESVKQNKETGKRVKGETTHPRVVFPFPGSKRSFDRKRQRMKDASKKSPHQSELPSRDRGTTTADSKSSSSDSEQEDECVPLKAWQATSFPTCNVLHEVEIDVVEHEDPVFEGERYFMELAEQEASSTTISWEVTDLQKDPWGSFVIQSARFEEHFDGQGAERQRIQAITMERLHASHHVTNIMGFCGHSIVTEYADGGTLDDELETFGSSLTPAEKLRYAADIAQSIADLHDVEQDAALVHGDIRGSSFAFVDDELKLVDLSSLSFPVWNKKKNVSCGFKGPAKDKKSKQKKVDTSPSDKSDIYRIGLLLFRLLMTETDEDCESDDFRGGEIREPVFNGSNPVLPDEIDKSFDNELTAIRGNMYLSLQKDPSKRPSAGEIADSLISAQGRGAIFLAGLARDATNISEHTWNQLVEMNCIYGFGIHIITSEAPTSDEIDRHRKKKDACAPFVVVKEEPDLPTLFPNRIDRIAYIREYQRQKLSEFFANRNNDKDIVMVADLDLFELPSRTELLGEISRMVQYPDFDVVCSAGQMFNPFGYYDIFATVLLPETFVYPLSGRLRGEYLPGEDQSMVRSDDVYGDFTQWDLMDDFEEKAQDSKTGVVPVMSCFGGLTIYRASKFFMPDCAYTNNWEHLLRFANKDDGRPCEHVVFHDCLAKNDLSTRIAVSPSLRTRWDQPPTWSHSLVSGGRIAEGLTKSNGLVTFSNARDKGTRLENGEYSLRINELGSLVVEKWQNSSSSEVTWMAETYSFYSHDDWAKMFLVLRDDGLLTMIQQVKYPPVGLDGVCKPFEPRGQACRTVVWTSGVASTNTQANKYELLLGDDGILKIENSETHQVLWSNLHANSPTNISSTPLHGPPSADTPVSCIPSGDERAINDALHMEGSEAVLCPRSVFLIAAPIVFSADGQKLYTLGHPVGGERALIKVVKPSMTEAVIMLGRSNVELSSVVVDGNRPELGYVLPSATSFGGALVSAGGAAEGQIISCVKVFEPRGWTCLHLQEGPPNSRCNGAVVENSEFGPAGMEGKDDWTADGISVACTNSRIQNNTITDVTDGGIVVFGAPGSTVRGNVIRAKTRGLHGGINMVDFAPFDGNYTGTQVVQNTIDAEGASIRVGLGMGCQIWLCFDSEKELPVLFGAQVSENTLHGSKMQYGFAADGVRDWNVTDNVDFAKHTGVPSVKCFDQVASPPEGFQINRMRSTGTFQNEFSDATLDLAVKSIPSDRELPSSKSSQDVNQHFSVDDSTKRHYPSRVYDIHKHQPDNFALPPSMVKP